MSDEEHRDPVELVGELRVGQAVPDWYNTDVVVQLLAQRLRALELRVDQLSQRLAQKR